MSSVTKRELIAMVHAGGLETDGKESLADLSEAIVNLVQAWKRREAQHAPLFAN